MLLFLLKINIVKATKPEKGFAWPVEQPFFPSSFPSMVFAVVQLFSFLAGTIFAISFFFSASSWESRWQEVTMTIFGWQLSTRIWSTLLYFQVKWWLVVVLRVKSWATRACNEKELQRMNTSLSLFSILLTHGGSHREVYRDFQPSLNIFRRWCQGWIIPQVPCTPSLHCPITNSASTQSQQPV